MNIEKRKIKDLDYAEYNPRKNLTKNDEEYKKIKKSIQTFGYVDPIIINSDNTIIGGHQRYKVLNELGYEEIDVVVVNLDKTNEKALNIALNKISGDWDYLKLDSLLEELKAINFDFEAIGFDNFEMNAIDEMLEDTIKVVDEIRNETNKFAVTFIFKNDDRNVLEEAIKLKSKEYFADVLIENMKQMLLDEAESA